MSTAVIPAPKKFVEKTDIVNNLTSTATDKPLSANMGKALNDIIPRIATVTYDIPNSTDTTTFDLPTGFNNAVLLGASCYTRYSTWVDYSYYDGEYFGDINYNATGEFRYTPRIAGNSTQIRFCFLRLN